MANSPLKDQLLVETQYILDKVKNPDRKNNQGAVLFEIFCWQEISKLSEEELRRAWTAAEANGILKADDIYRAKGPGESIAAESGHFSVLMKVSKPRESIDKEKFLTAVAKKARISLPALEELWDANQKVGKASLSKRVLEA